MKVEKSKVKCCTLVIALSVDFDSTVFAPPLSPSSHPNKLLRILLAKDLVVNANAFAGKRFYFHLKALPLIIETKFSTFINEKRSATASRHQQVKADYHTHRKKIKIYNNKLFIQDFEVQTKCNFY